MASTTKNGVCSKDFRATGKDLAKLREECRLKQRGFAQFLGVSPGTLATWENRRDRHLSAPANVIYHLAERKTREARTVFQETLAELKASMYS